MSDDFTSALHGAAARAAGEHADTRERTGALRPEQLVGAARRRRRTRTALTAGAASLAVVGVAVVGALAVDVRGDRSPLPASTHTTGPISPAPTGTPSTSGVALPKGDPSLPFGVCGSVVGSDPVHPSTSELTLETELAAPEVGAGERLAVTSIISVGPDSGNESPGLGQMDGRGPSYAITRDGVVVAVADLYAETVDPGVAIDPIRWLHPFDAFEPGPGDPAWYSTSLQRVLTGTVPLAVCAPGDDGGPAGASGVPLPAGEYELHALLTLKAYVSGPGVPELPGDPEEVFMTADLSAVPDTVASAPPVAFSVAGTAAEPVPAPAGTGRLPDLASFSSDHVDRCNDPAPVPTDPTSSLALRHDLTHADVGTGGPIRVEADVVYTGPGRLDVDMGLGVDLLVVRDGLLVGTGSTAAASLYTVVGLGTDASIGVSGTATLVGCSVAPRPGETYVEPGPLPPGTYTVYPRVPVHVGALVTDEGRVESSPPAGDEGHMLVGAPFEVTVTG